MFFYRSERKQTAFPVRFLLLLVSAACAFSLSACSRGSRHEESREETQTETAAYDEEESYGESEAVSGVNETGSPYYGILYASVLDVNGKDGDSSTVYSFKDKSDPENAWSVTGLEIGDIETEMTPGTDVAILFHGDIIRDAENLEFIAIVPDGNYIIKRAEGTTVSNTMSTFTLSTPEGITLSFIKDNCPVEEDAMNTDSGDSVTVYYADGGTELGNYPLSVYKLK